MHPNTEARSAIPEWVYAAAFCAIAPVVCARWCRAPATSDLRGAWYVADSAPVRGALGAVMLVTWAALAAKPLASAPCDAVGGARAEVLVAGTPFAVCALLRCWATALVAPRAVECQRQLVVGPVGAAVCL